MRNETQVLMPDTHGSTAVPAVRVPTSGAGTLPPDLELKAVSRLARVTLIYAATYTAAYGSEMALHGVDEASWPEMLKGDMPIAAASVLLALAFFALLRSGRLPSRTALSLGLLYEPIGAFGIEVTRFWEESPGQFAGLSYVPIWMLCFSVIVPAPPRRTALAALATASMAPLALALCLGLGRLELPPDARAGQLVLVFFPNYIIAALACICSSIVYNLGRDVGRARRMGSYELLEPLGRGGMGEVWRARHQMLARPAAVKLMRPEALGTGVAEAEAALARFEREAQSIAELRSPHTILLYDFGRTDTGLLYYAMELLHGLDLQQLIERFGPMGSARAAFLLDQGLHSLAEAHRRGLLHRDIKPSNLFVTESAGEHDFVKVLDFGLVKQLGGAAQDAIVTQGGTILGTPLYMAPERFYGEETADARSDLYSLGAVGYFLVAGEPVFAAKNPMQALVDHARTPPRPLRDRSPAISDAFDRMVLRALEKDPDSRFPDAAAFRAALRALPEWGLWTAAEAARWWQEHTVSATSAGPAANGALANAGNKPTGAGRNLDTPSGSHGGVGEKGGLPRL